MALGILDLVGLGASLIFALPVAGYGLGQITGGDPVVGGVAVVVAALMVYLPQRITTPGDVPGKILGGAVGSAVTTPEEGDEGDDATDRK